MLQFRVDTVYPVVWSKKHHQGVMDPRSAVASKVGAETAIWGKAPQEPLVWSAVVVAP